MTGSWAARGSAGRRITGIVAAGVLTAGVLLAGAGPAAAWSVLYAAVAASGSGDCSSPADACPLSAALAQVTAGGTVVLVTPGRTARYVGNWTIGTAGTSARQPVIIRARAGLSSAPILDGNGPDAPPGQTCSTASCAGPVLTVAAGVHVKITRIAIADGYGDGNSSVGGGMFVAGSATVTSSAFTDDYAYGGGGAIATGYDGKGSLTITNSTFTGDSAFVAGGAIASGDDGRGSVTVTGSAFTGDNVYASGGAIASGYNDSTGAPLTVTDSTFSGDSTGAGGGGAIASGDLGGAGALTVTGSTFQGGYAGSGAAIYVGGPKPARVTASTFTDNSVKYSGGAIATAGTGPPSLTVTASTFTGNGAGELGGAIFNQGEVPGPMTVTASTFAGNFAYQGGGAIFGGPLTVTASTFAGNHADEHGATIEGYTERPVWVAADVFTGWCDHDGSPWHDAGYNAGSNATCFGASPPATDVDAGSAAALKLGPLADNGGPTQTVLPEAGSPVIGIIPDPTSVTLGGSQVALCPATDQRGYASAPGPCDAGSVQTTGHA